jgi:transposase
MGNHKPKAIGGAHRVWLLQRIQAGDFRLRGLVAELAERGLKADYRSVWSFGHAEKLSFKKPWWLASASVPTWRGGGPSGQSISAD